MHPRQRTLQIHPSLRCNLRCTHCYSSSGPGLVDGLAPDLVRRAIDEAAALGYERVSFSGGEPLLYRALPDLLEHAKTIGLRTALTTNGLAFGGGRLDAVAPFLDLVAVSCDGPRELHDSLRGAGTFDRMSTALQRLRACGVPFGLIHTVTRRSWPVLTEIAAFAARHGAALMQFHPLEMVGRATREMSADALDRGTRSRAWLLARALQVDYGDRLDVRIDLLTRPTLLSDPDQVVPAVPVPGSRASDALGVLVLEPDGAVVPLVYGISREFAVADLTRAGLAESWPGYATTRHPALRRLCEQQRDECLATDDQLFSWFDLLTARSHGAVPARGGAA